MTDGNLQLNRTERKFPFNSVTLCRLHSVPFRCVRKGIAVQLPKRFKNFDENLTNTIRFKCIVGDEDREEEGGERRSGRGRFIAN
uniref:Uncharacterized protein n=1 Tax=Romanomermis culicivorax TaxID=13658 RepID=A0A915HJ22_ROMCU